MVPPSTSPPLCAAVSSYLSASLAALRDSPPLSLSLSSSIVSVSIFGPLSFHLSLQPSPFLSLSFCLSLAEELAIGI